MKDKIDLIKRYEFMFQTWEEFVNETQLPFGLKKRAIETKNELNYNCPYVIWDPLDDETGYLLMGDNAEEIINETINFYDMQ